MKSQKTHYSTCKFISKFASIVTVLALVFTPVANLVPFTPQAEVAEASGMGWALYPSVEQHEWQSIAYGNGLYVAVTWEDGGHLMTSPDGINWTMRESAQGEWFDVTYGNGLFVAAGDGGVITSSDGITWTLWDGEIEPVGDRFTWSYWRSVVYADGLFVVVGGTDGGGNWLVITSPDGINWTGREATIEDGPNWTSVTYGNGLFVALSGAGHVMTSPDAITWSPQTPSQADTWWSSVTYGEVGGNGLFVAVAAGGEGSRIMTSPDGITWTNQTAPTTQAWNSVAYGDGLFVVVGNSGYTMTSPDGVAWEVIRTSETNNWNGVTYANGTFIAVANNGTNRVGILGDLYGGGTGTENDPYIIETPQHFRNISVQDDDAEGLYFRLANDITLPSNFEPFEFEGVFDGDNHTVHVETPLFSTLYGDVSNLNIEGSLEIEPDNSVYDIGLLAGGIGYDVNTIENVTVSGEITITAEYCSSIGGLAGWVDGATINNVISDVDIVAPNCERVGGLIGNLYSSSINQTAALGDVSGHEGVGGLIGFEEYSTISESFATGDVVGEENVGGLIGEATDTSINNSYARGSVTGDTNVGGLLGVYGMSMSEKAYSTGVVTGSENVGGFIGSVGEASFVESFWDIETSGQLTTSHNVGTGISTAAMKTESTYDLGAEASWNFTTIWMMDEDYNSGYPCLRWSDISCSEYDDDGNGGGGTPEDDGVTTLAATNITRTSATLHATIGADFGTYTRYGFDYDTVSQGANYFISDEASGSPTGPYSMDIGELECGTEYFFNAVVTNEVEGQETVTVTGSELTFTTLACGDSGGSGGGSSSGGSSGGYRPSTTQSNTSSSVSDFINQYRSLFTQAHNAGIALPSALLALLGLDTNVSTPIPGLCPRYTFTRDLEFGDEGEDVRALQRFLNCAGFSLATSGPGAPGEETQYFVDRTLSSVIRFQQAYLSDIITIQGLAAPTGIFAEYSRNKAYTLMRDQ